MKRSDQSWVKVKMQPTNSLEWRQPMGDPNAQKDWLAGPLPDAQMYPDDSGQPKGLLAKKEHTPTALYGILRNGCPL